MLKNKLFPVAALLGLGFMATAHAADQVQDDRWYVAPFASYIHSGGDRNASDGWGGGAGFGKILDQHFNVELRGFYQGYSGKTAPLSLSGGTADAQFYFFRDKFSPYAVLAAGGIDTCLGAKCGGGFIGEAGLGFTYEILDNLSFRTDARYRYNNNLNNHIQPGATEFNDLVVNAGFVIPFGDKPKAYTAKAIEPVVASPAPAPRPVSTLDCSTLDSDNDGVNNCLDKCPDTARGSKVDSYGCPIKLILRGNQFKVDSAKLTPEAMSILDEVAASVINYPEKNEIKVEGYASSEGKAAHNLKLSQNRANSVVSYLKKKGVSNKLSAKGYGIANPIADNRTEAGRAENRRVELIWIKD